MAGIIRHQNRHPAEAHQFSPRPRWQLFFARDLQSTEHISIMRGLGLVAQSVEQRIENPCVGGSIPPRATKILSCWSDWGFWPSKYQVFQTGVPPHIEVIPMKLASHLRRSRHGVFYFRIVFPQILATILGQPELNRSLSTRCPKTARLTGYQLSGTMLPLITRLARLMTIDPDSLDPASIKNWLLKD